VRYMQAPQPVFRAAPYLMELHRQRQQSSGRVVMLARLPHLDVAVTTASIGPAIPGMRSPNLEAVAAEMDLVLPAGTLHEFDELRDTVRCDLILTMDRFDHAEVQKEMTHGAEHAALRAAVHDIAAACRHLVGSLAQLKARAGASTSLRIALACLLQCPALDPQVLTARRRAASLRRPLWRSEGGRLLTLRTLRGEGRVVAARRAPVVPCGHWRDARSVDEALQAWLAARGGDGGGRLPTQAALRASSANSLSWARAAWTWPWPGAGPTGTGTCPRWPPSLAPYLLREQEGSAPRLPTAAALVAEGRTDLVRAIRLNGGFKACARKLVMYEEAGGGKEDGVDGRLNLGSPWAARRMPQTPGQARQEGRLEAAAARISHDAKTGATSVSFLEAVGVGSAEAAQSLLERATKQRAIGCTAMNEHSSRSHMVFMLSITGNNDETGQTVRGQLNLVDLAGSERLSRSGVEGKGVKETQAINKSLSALGDVIAALVNKDTHVPYRNSRLTHLLQGCLGGASGKALMLVHVAPEPGSAQETLCSLRFAAKVGAVEVGTARRQVAAAPT
ncbi:hypothetical protein APUTEX25_004566, partial [Auxenochlorella protothecoides]